MLLAAVCQSHAIFQTNPIIPLHKKEGTKWGSLHANISSFLYRTQKNRKRLHAGYKWRNCWSGFIWMVTPRILATLKFFQGNTMMMNTYPKVKCSSSRCTSPGVMRPKSKWSMFGPSWPASLPLKIEERKRSVSDCMNNALLQLYWMSGIFHYEKKKLSNINSLKYCSSYRHSLRSKRLQLSLARKLEREPKKIGIVLLSSQLSRWTCTETLATQTTVDNFLITPKDMGLHGYSFIHIKELGWQKRTEQTSCEIW